MDACHILLVNKQKVTAPILNMYHVSDLDHHVPWLRIKVMNASLTYKKTMVIRC